MVRKEQAILPEGIVRLIGVSGKKHTRKQIVVELIKNKISDIYEKQVISTKFSNHLKQTLISLYSPRLQWDHLEKDKDEHIDGLVIDNKIATGRKLMQCFGDFCRSINGDVWVDRILKRCLPNYIYIIGDVRYQNEANAIIDKGGLLIRIEENTSVNDHHSSEIDLDEFIFPVIIEDSKDLDGDVNYILNNLINV